MANLPALTEFVNGTVADAVQVNGNFAIIKNKINGNIESDNIKDANVTLAKLGSDVSSGFLLAGAFVNDSDSSGTITVNLNASSNHVVTLTGTGRTIQFTGTPVNGQVYRIILKQDATGSRTVTTYPTIRWSGGSAPTLTTTANKADVITLLYDGSEFFASATIGF